ncbi:MAG: heparinase II/III family protein [Roseburia sp.]|nr:heparinase II/III family protein [Roseburia sp.]
MLSVILSDEKIEQLRTHPYYREMYRNVKQYADEVCGTIPHVLPYSKFKLFDESGSRWTYEEAYYEHRKRLNALTLCYLIFGEEKYRTALEDIIWAICDEFTWVLPAHMWSAGSVEEKEVYLDLFACETGMALAEILSMTAASLDGLVVERAKKEIRRRIIEPYFADTFYWEKERHNWAAVCAGCIGMTFFYEAKAEEVDAVLPRILATMDCFLESYPEDGCCLEGLDYWDYGFGFYVYFAERLEKYSGGKYQLLKAEKVEKIAHYLQNIRLGNRYAAAFSDSENQIVAFPGLVHFLHRIYENIDVLPNEVLTKYGDDPTQRWAAFIRDYAWTSPYNKVNMRSGATYYESAEWFIYNGAYYSFAAKAGHNNVPHNHNDVGSFLYCVGDNIILTDPGKGEYTKQYFSQKRYEFFVTSSRGHSVPIINGMYQKQGSEFRGEVLFHDEKHFCLEMAGAYGIDTLSSLKRSFVLEESGILIEDEFLFNQEAGEIIERFILSEEPVINGTYIQIGSQKMTGEFDKYNISVRKEDYAGSLGKPKSVYVLDFALKMKEKHVKCTFCIAG